MPDPLSILRLVALIVFIALVAVGLWLLDVAWWIVPPVMAGALLIAWTIEWLAWRGSVSSSVVMDTEVPPSAQAPVLEEDEEEEEPAAPAPPLPPLAVPEPEAVAPPTEPLPPSPPEPEPEPETEPQPEPTPPEPTPPEPEPEPKPEPTPEPEPGPTPPELTPPEPEPVPPVPTAEEKAVPQVRKPPERIAPPRRPRRFRLRSVPAERREPGPASPPTPIPSPPEASPVVEFRPRTTVPREWNLWDLERIAREEAGEHPERREEWAYLFLHLRQFASPDGSLPAEFDPLVRESFGGLLERAPRV